MDFSALRYFNQTSAALTMKDLGTGLVKSECIAVIIVMVACYEGFRTEGGGVGVGKATTTTVVASIFLIIAADVLLTALFYSSF